MATSWSFWHCNSLRWNRKILQLLPGSISLPVFNNGCATTNLVAFVLYNDSINCSCPIFDCIFDNEYGSAIEANKDISLEALNDVIAAQRSPYQGFKVRDLYFCYPILPLGDFVRYKPQKLRTTMTWAPFLPYLVLIQIYQLFC